MPVQKSCPSCGTKNPNARKICFSCKAQIRKPKAISRRDFKTKSSLSFLKNKLEQRANGLWANYGYHVVVLYFSDKPKRKRVSTFSTPGKAKEFNDKFLPSFIKLFTEFMKIEQPPLDKPESLEAEQIHSVEISPTDIPTKSAPVTMVTNIDPLSAIPVISEEQPPLDKSESLEAEQIHSVEISPTDIPTKSAPVTMVTNIDSLSGIPVISEEQPPLDKPESLEAEQIHSVEISPTDIPTKSAPVTMVTNIDSLSAIPVISEGDGNTRKEEEVAGCHSKRVIFTLKKI